MTKMTNNPNPEVQQQCVLMPIPLFQQITELVRDRPFRQVEPLIQQLMACQIVDVSTTSSPLPESE